MIVLGRGQADIFRTKAEQTPHTLTHSHAYYKRWKTDAVSGLFIIISFEMLNILARSSAREYIIFIFTNLKLTTSHPKKDVQRKALKL